MILSNNVLSFQRTQEVLAWLCTISDHRAVILEVPMGTQMDWCPCSGCSTRQLDTVTKEVEGERALLPYILSLGILILKSSCSSGRTMVKKSPEHVICSMLSGSQIFS
jgi:hypothetical protein